MMQTTTYPTNVKNSQGYDRDSAFVYNQGIVTQNEYEALERTVNHIYLSTIAKQIYQLSATDSLSIFSIASLCPALGGSAVYMARSIVVLFNDTLAFDDDSLCIAQGVLLRHANTDNTTSVNELSNDVKVFPNPTNNLIYISFSEAFDKPYVFKLFDVTGRLVLNTLLVDQQQSISLIEHINSTGIYYYTIQNSEGSQSYQGKVNFIK